MDNRIYFSDNLPILKSLPDESIDLIYIDPPFNTKKIQKRTRIKTIKDIYGDRRGFKGNIYRTIEIETKSYNDKYEYFIDNFLRPRLLEAFRLLKKHGGLYFHIDYREVHYCKILLDEIFGRDSYINEIIWAYDYGGRAKSKWPTKHDNILFYVKNPKGYIFNPDEIDREDYMAPGLVGPEKAKRGKMPTDTWWPVYSGTKKAPISLSDSWWAHHIKNKNITDIWTSGKIKSKGQSDVWWQTIVPTTSKERIGYPTQKPRKLIDRIIKASSYQGNVVLDFFAGSGTVGESCLELGRKFILVENNETALEIMAKRFNGVKDIEWVNFDPKPYQVDLQVNKPTNSQDKRPNLRDEFIMLAGVANYLRDGFEETSDQWNNSPFRWILNLPPGRKGKLAHNLIKYWLSIRDGMLDLNRGNGNFLLINNHRFIIKFSTLWVNGVYKFQQIRSSGYDYIICLGISPFDVHCWIFEKDFALTHAIPQHRGSKVADYWMEINSNYPPEWAIGKGGTLENAYRIIKNLRK